MSEPLGILLISGTHERAHYAYMVAVAAAAIGRPTTLFATNHGCRALLRDWSSLRDSARDAIIQQRGVAGLDELRTAANELGVRLLACDSGLLMAGLDPGRLMPEVEVVGLPTFLSATDTSDTISL